MRDAHEETYFVYEIVVLNASKAVRKVVGFDASKIVLGDAETRRAHFPGRPGTRGIQSGGAIAGEQELVIRLPSSQ